MNTARRVQLFLSPVMIAMLCIMLAVVSFGWYQAEFNGQIEVTDSSVDVTVQAPPYIDVDLSNPRDNYSYSDGEFTINESDEYLGYFGQTGEFDVDSSELDRTYIVFFDMVVVGSNKDIDVNTAYVDGIEIVKNDEVIVQELGWEKEESKFKVYFYSRSDNKLVEQGEKFDNKSSPRRIDSYVIGIHFDDNIDEKFDYSDFEYYGSTYKIHLKFYLD